jgi:hypothetical protein
MSGQQLFTSLNTNLGTAGQTLRLTAPAPVVIPELGITELVADVSSVSLTATFADPTPAGYTMVTQATPLLSPGIGFYKSRFRQVSLDPASVSGAVATLNLYTAWGAKYGALQTDQRIAVRCYLIDETTGQAGTPVEASVVVVP